MAEENDLVFVLKMRDEASAFLQKHAQDGGALGDVYRKVTDVLGQLGGGHNKASQAANEHNDAVDKNIDVMKLLALAAGSVKETMAEWVSHLGLASEALRAFGIQGTTTITIIGGDHRGSQGVDQGLRGVRGPPAEVHRLRPLLRHLRPGSATAVR